MGKGKAKRLRELHINEEIWQWYMRKDTVVIFSPAKNRFTVEREYFAAEDDEYNLWEYETYVTPKQVKEYIIEKLI